MQHSGGYMETIGLCSNGPPTSLESPHSAAPPTETPPPGYMSEDGDPIDHNDNMSKQSHISLLPYGINATILLNIVRILNCITIRFALFK